MEIGKKLFSLVVVSFFAVSLNVFAQDTLNIPECTQTLLQAFIKAYETNPTIQGKQADSWAAWQQVKKIKAGYFPQVQLQYGYGYEQDSLPGLPSRSASAQERSATLNQLLFDGGVTSNQVGNAKALFSQSRQKALETMNDIGFQVSDAYLEVLQNQELVVLAQNNLQSHLYTLKRMIRRYSLGIGIKSEITLAQARVAQAQTILFERQKELETTRIVYLRLVGNPPVHLILPPIPTSAAYGASLSCALKQAHTFNPTIAAAKSALLAAMHNVAAAKAQLYVPNVSLQLTTTRNRNIGGLRGLFVNTQGLVVANYTILNGGADLASLRQSIAQKESAEYALEDDNRLIEQNIQEAWTNLQIAKNQVVSLRESVRADAAVVEAYKKEFLLGKRSLLNLLDMQNELYNSQTALVRAQFTIRISVFQLMEGVGTLPGYFMGSPFVCSLIRSVHEQNI